MGEFVVQPDDPDAADVRALIDAHFAFGAPHVPVEDAHALDAEGLQDDSISFFSVRRRADGTLLAMGALRQLDDTHAELKSMHTVEAARGQGIGRALVDYLVGLAADRGYRRVSIETGAMAAFLPAQALYRSAGFVPCPPFGDYQAGRNSVCMTLLLDAPPTG